MTKSAVAACVLLLAPVTHTRAQVLQIIDREPNDGWGMRQRIEMPRRAVLRGAYDSHTPFEDWFAFTAPPDSLDLGSSLEADFTCEGQLLVLLGFPDIELERFCDPAWDWRGPEESGARLAPGERYLIRVRGAPGLAGRPYEVGLRLTIDLQVAAEDVEPAADIGRFWFAQPGRTTLIQAVQRLGIPVLDLTAVQPRGEVVLLPKMLRDDLRVAARLVDQGRREGREPITVRALGWRLTSRREAWLVFQGDTLYYGVYPTLPAEQDPEVLQRLLGRPAEVYTREYRKGDVFMRERVHAYPDWGVAYSSVRGPLDFKVVMAGDAAFKAWWGRSGFFEGYPSNYRPTGVQPAAGPHEAKPTSGPGSGGLGQHYLAYVRGVRGVSDEPCGDTGRLARYSTDVRAACEVVLGREIPPADGSTPP